MIQPDSPEISSTGLFEVHAHAAALYVALLRARMPDEATEFAEWYLDTFDHDLEE